MNVLTTFLNALPGNVSQGLIWGILAIGVFITYKILDFPDLTVDGSIGTGGAVAVMLITMYDYPIWLALLCAFAAGCLAGLATGLLNTALGIPGILAGILTQLALYSINLDIMGQSNRPVSVDKYPLVVSSRYAVPAMIKSSLIVAVIIAILYWFSARNTDLQSAQQAAILTWQGPRA